MHGLDGIKSTQPPLPYETLVTGMATSVQPTMRKDHPGHRETMCGIFPLCSNGGDVGGLLAMRRFFFGQQGSQDETLIEVQRTCWLHGKALLRNPLESSQTSLCQRLSRHSQQQGLCSAHGNLKKRAKIGGL